MNEVNSPQVLQEWTLDMDVPAEHMKQAGSFAEMVAYLRSIPQHVIRSKQQALERERGKFMYVSARDGTDTTLTRILLERMCDHANRIKPTQHAVGWRTDEPQPVGGTSTTGQ